MQPSITLRCKRRVPQATEEETVLSSSKMPHDRGDKLVLGFDAGCARCSELARRIEERVGGRLEVRSLHDPQVEQWREMALGKEAPWAPTLIEVRDGKVRAWTGTMMGVRLGSALGLVSTWQILQALGEFREASRGDASANHRAQMAPGISRGQFLKGLGGVAVAVSLMGSTGISQAALARVSSSLTKGTPSQRAVVKKVVRSSTQFKNLERELRQSFEFGHAEFVFDEEWQLAVLSVPTKSVNGNGAAASFFVELQDRQVSYYRHLVSESGGTDRYEVTVYENGESLGRTVVGPTQVVTPDGRRFTREEFREEAGRLKRAHRRTAPTFLAQGGCADCRYYRTRRCRWVVFSTCTVGGRLNPWAGFICSFVYFYGSTISDGCEAWARRTCYIDRYCR